MLVEKRLRVTGPRWWVPRWKVDLREEHKPEWQKHRKYTIRQPAPRIEALGAPVKDPYAPHSPETLGPIPPAWHPRLPKGGTYDDHWQDHVWPN